MNIIDVASLITIQSIKDLNNQIDSSPELLKQIQEEAEGIYMNSNQNRGRTLEQILQCSRMGKRAELVLLNLRHPITGELLFKNNPKNFHDLIFIPTGEEVEVKSRRDICTAESYISTMSSIKKYNDCTWVFFFISDQKEISFYKLIDFKALINDSASNKTSNKTIKIVKNSNSYTLSNNQLARILKDNLNVLFLPANVTKSANWCNVNKRVSKFKNGGFYFFEKDL